MHAFMYEIDTNTSTIVRMKGVTYFVVVCFVYWQNDSKKI